VPAPLTRDRLRLVLKSWRWIQEMGELENREGSGSVVSGDWGMVEGGKF
jgi:hypothetical protein